MFKNNVKRISNYWWVALIAWFIVDFLRTGLSADIPLTAYSVVDIVLVILFTINRVLK